MNRILGMGGGGRHGGGRGRLQVPDFVHDAVDGACPSWWKQGCGCNACFGATADVLETVTPAVEAVGNCIWIFGSPLAFPLIFCFAAAPHTRESSGYEMSMLEAPCRRPCTCCAASCCIPCAQHYVRRKVLGGDMTKYKLWQGYHDGDHCFRRVCPSNPCIHIEAGTYGEQDCPNTFLCLEICCLGGIYSTCCAFDVSRRYQRDERGLGIDPTEHRQKSCIQFFSRIMHHCFKLGCCLCCTGCVVGVCAPDSAGAQDFAGEAGRAARACCRIAHTLWKGIIWTRVIGMGCMTTQMIHEADTPWDGEPKARPDLMLAPKNEKMEDRGDGHDESQPQNRNKKDDEPVEMADMLMPWEQEAVAASKSPRNQRMEDRDAEEEKQAEVHHSSSHPAADTADEIEVTPYQPASENPQAKKNQQRKKRQQQQRQQQQRQKRKQNRQKNQQQQNRGINE